MWHCGLALAVGMVLSGCEQPKDAVIVSSPYADGAEHVEPIVYNGKHYDVSFRFEATGQVFDVKVEGRGRKLRETPGDQKIVEQVAISAVRHFACPTGQRGQVVSGSAQHGDDAWEMRIRCA